MITAGDLFVFVFVFVFVFESMFVFVFESMFVFVFVFGATDEGGFRAGHPGLF